MSIKQAYYITIVNVIYFWVTTFQPATIKEIKEITTAAEEVKFY